MSHEKDLNKIVEMLEGELTAEQKKGQYPPWQKWQSMMQTVLIIKRRSTT